MSVTRVFFISRGGIRTRRGSLLPCMAQLLLQVVNLQLHVFILLLLGGMTPCPRVALARVCSMHATLLISPTLKVKEVVLSLGPRRPLLLRSQSYHALPLYSLLHKFFPQTALIVGSRFRFLAQDVNGSKPNKPNTMNL